MGNYVCTSHEEKCDSVSFLNNFNFNFKICLLATNDNLQYCIRGCDSNKDKYRAYTNIDDNINELTTHLYMTSVHLIRNPVLIEKNNILMIFYKQSIYIILTKSRHKKISSYSANARITNTFN